MDDPEDTKFVKPPRDDHVILCGDDLDLCSTIAAPNRFPVGQIGTWTVHGDSCAPHWSYVTPIIASPWTAKRMIFIPKLEYSRWHSAVTADWSDSELRLITGGGLDHPPMLRDPHVEICFNIPNAYKDQLWEAIEEFEPGYKHTENSPVQIRFMEDMAPCALCGEFLYSRCAG
jgi:hypothetical protein